MSKCELRIELDREEPLYKVGDTVTCVVHVSVSDTVQCNGLSLINMWETHGRGNRDSDRISSVELFKGEWQAGEYRYTYSFEINEGPLTYRGHYINIDRYINVSADIPWAFDPKANIEYLVEKGESLPDGTPTLDGHYNLALLQGNVPAWLEHLLNPKTRDPMRFFKPLVALSLLLFSIGSYILFSTFFIVSEYGVMLTVDPFNIGDILNAMTDFGLGSVIIAPILCIAGLFIGIKMIKKKILFGKIGVVVFEIQTPSLRAGDKAAINFEFTPNVDIDVNHIRFSLLGSESATSGSGTNRSTVRHEFHKSEQELSRKGAQVRDMPVIEKVYLEIPAEVPPSFSAANNQLTWRIQASMDINNSPDWQGLEKLELLI